MQKPEKFWSFTSSELMHQLNTGPKGLSEEEAGQRKNLSHQRKAKAPFLRGLGLLLRQFKNPLTLILVFAVILSSVLAEFTNALIISGIVLLTGLLGFWQERNAGRAVEKLRALVQVKVTVLRSGGELDIVTDAVVPGDIIILNAGDIIPADCIIIDSKDLHVNESALTGESFPAEKASGKVDEATPLNKRKNTVFKGTNVVSGTATVLAVNTGADTEIGEISAELEKNLPETAFETGIRKFGYMLMRVTLVLSIIIMALNVYYGKPVTDSFLFALALAVGMTPELLPAIVTITHAAGAERMARKKVIVKKLSAIQNLGAVDVFCSDKTGTLTEGTIRVDAAVDAEGNKSDKVMLYAFLNASFESGFTNPLDQAIRELKLDITAYTKADEVPYDFIRKRLSVVVQKQDAHLMITKGALANVLEVCTSVETSQGEIVPLAVYKNKIMQAYEQYGLSGARAIGICYRNVSSQAVINKDEEHEMIFLGFVLLSDPVKAGVGEVIEDLRQSGISLKLITGDNRFIAAHVGEKIGIDQGVVLTGSDLQKISSDALVAKVRQVSVFAEIEPGQKERIVQALRKGGSTVGFIGDGINDVSALKAADVGISVDTAVDVAKETADIVFLEKDLKVLHAGITEGRKTFANTLKYIFITTSANFGNMFSVAAASLFLPFLPLLPKQILMTNFLTDLPAMALSSDSVDEEVLKRPGKWDTRLIRNFMIVFGIQSSLFDLLTFFVLLGIFGAGEDEFRTGWFIESVVTEVLILMIIRTQRKLFRSKPGKLLVWISLLVVITAGVLPYSPLSADLGFSSLPFKIITGMGIIAILYGVSAEITKKIFFRKMGYRE